MSKLISEEIIKTKYSKYSCDHYFFSREDERSFYWAGFIAASKCAYIKSGNNILKINLSEKDLNHLIDFKNHINYNGLIYKSTSKNSLINLKWKDSIINTLVISSFQISNDLKRFNINLNKAEIYTLPNWVMTHKLVNHFMRGYCDSRGSFYYDKSGNKVCFELKGTKEFLTDYKAILESSFKIKSDINITMSDSTAKIKYSGKKNVPQIVDFLYKDATIFLNRKYEIANNAK